MPEVEVTAITLGAYGIAHHEGSVVMVPNAAPGDRLEVALDSRRHGAAIGTVLRVIAPGPHRRTPPCPYLPRCGGCDWQQIDYPEQVRLKGEAIAAELGRALGIELDPAGLVEPCEREFGYRSRIRLKAGAGGALGFYELLSNRLVAINRCLLAEPGIEVPGELAHALGRGLDEIEAVAASGGRQVLVAHLRKPAARAQVEAARRVLDSGPSIAGIVLRAGAAREVLGDAEIEAEIEPGVALRLDADLFSQVNRAQNRKLVAEVMEMAAPAPDLALLDLFCGGGNFSIPAALRGARVTGVDSDAPAVAAAARNAARLSLPQASAQFLAMRAEQTADFLGRAGYHPQAVVMDPPRTGAAALIEPISRMRPASIVYVACDVTTQARDLRRLCTAGYRISRVRAYDFFPNTHHAEIAALVVLT
jgi:23S rRNA (uracil1939-C5)-methyltransferase